MVINIAPNRTILNYGYMEQFWDVAKNIFPALLMGACIYPIARTGLPPMALLAVQIPAGAAVYLLLSLALRTESFFLLLKHARQRLARRKNGMRGSA